MTTPLSARRTFFYKFILPVLAFGGMCYGAWRAFLHPDEVVLSNGMGPEQAWIVVLALGVFIAALVWWTVAWLKQVAIDGDELLISNFRTEIRVPLATIESIRGPSATIPNRYTVTFVEATEFGRMITFMPPMVWSMNPWAESEMVVELRNAWAAARDVESKKR